MKDLEKAKKILGMKITRDRGSRRLWLSQENYVLKVLERFNMTEVRSVTTPLAGHFKLSCKKCPQSLVEKEEMSRVPYACPMRSLMYDMLCARPDLTYAVSIVSQFMPNLRKQYWEVVKWVLRYLRETVILGLVFQRLKMGKPRLLQGYVNADYARDLNQRRSTTGYMFTVIKCVIS